MMYRRAVAILALFVWCAGCTDQPPAKPPPAAGKQPSAAGAKSQKENADAPPAKTPQPPARPATIIRTEIADNVYLEVVRDDLPLGLGYAGMVGQAFLQAGWLAGHTAAVDLGPSVALPQQMHFVGDWHGGNIRFVVVRSWVCLRQGYLEHFLSLPFKAHESILATVLNAQAIHAGLVATGANPGRPVQWLNDKGEEEYRPPSGDKIKITLRFENDGRVVEVPAQRWVRESKTKKELQLHWIFAGSKLFDNPDGPQLPKFYGANDGRVICTANFPTALLDLPIASKPGDPTVGLDWEANTPLIPPRDTTVLVILEPLRSPVTEKK